MKDWFKRLRNVLLKPRRLRRAAELQIARMERELKARQDREDLEQQRTELVDVIMTAIEAEPKEVKLDHDLLPPPPDPNVMIWPEGWTERRH